MLCGFRLPLAFTLACGLGYCVDSQLDALRATMLTMRNRKPGSGGPRDATPELTTAKHQLRDWVENNLAEFAQRADELELERKLNRQILDSKLSCDAQACPDWYLTGYLGQVKVHRNRGFLVVETGVGIECGFDESAYLYSWNGERWTRIWQIEQNNYTTKEYKPQTIEDISVSSYSAGNEYMVLVLGSQSWCASNWREIYYRAYRLGPRWDAKPLIDVAQSAFLGRDPPIQGVVTESDVLVEFAAGSFVGSFTREYVRHYAIDHDTIKRIDPLALSPRDFVSEWLATDWRESAHWSESANRKAMLDWHNELHRDNLFGDFIYPTRHCPSKPDLWQVGIDLGDGTPVGSPPSNPVYFTVRWRPPYRFSMVGVSDKPDPACTEKDRNADDEIRTLFAR
jgi:hypothetical protein